MVIKISRIVLILALLNVAHSNVFSQSKLLLQHKSNNWRHKTLRLNKSYTILTNDSVYHSSIDCITDSSLFTHYWKESGRDTTYKAAYYANVKDTFITRPIYVKDSIEIMFTEIKLLKHQWIRGESIVGGFAMFSLGLILSVPFIPVAALDKDPDALNDLFRFQGYLAAVSGSAILLLRINRKYDTAVDWSISTKHSSSK